MYDEDLIQIKCECHIMQYLKKKWKIKLSQRSGNGPIDYADEAKNTNVNIITYLIRFNSDSIQNSKTHTLLTSCFKCEYIY